MRGHTSQFQSVASRHVTFQWFPTQIIIIYCEAQQHNIKHV